MDRFIVKEPRVGAEYPQGNQMIAYSANAGGSKMIQPETMYLSGPFASEYLNAQHLNEGVVNAGHNMTALHMMNPQHNIAQQQNLYQKHNTNSQNNTNPQYTMNPQHQMNQQVNMKLRYNPNPLNNMDPQYNVTQYDMNLQQHLKVQHNMNTVNYQHSFNHQSINPQTPQTMQSSNMPGQGHVSGIDPRYLSGYADNSAQYILNDKQMQRNANPITPSFGSDYQNRSFSGIDRNKQNSFTTHAVPVEAPKIKAIPKPQQHQIVDQDQKSNQKPQNTTPLLKKPNELALPKNDIQNQTASRADKLKALQKSGPRAFSGTIEKVLKWHKSLQDIGVFVFYEVVGCLLFDSHNYLLVPNDSNKWRYLLIRLTKCVSVRDGGGCAKNLVIRDDNGPAMQVVYYEIDFMLPELKPPCTIRVIGRMVAGTSRLQAFNVRPATGDDVSILPRRAAVAAHHVAKLCKEYGPNAP